jgi:hypothetical protein
MLRALEPEPKCGGKHQVTLGGLYETGLAAILFIQGAVRNYLSIRSWVTPSPGPPRLEKAPVAVHPLPFGRADRVPYLLLDTRRAVGGDAKLSPEGAKTRLSSLGVEKGGSQNESDGNPTGQSGPAFGSSG